MRRHKRRQPAFALVLVLTTVVIAAVLGMSYLSSASVRLTSSTNMVKMSRAKYLAESGLEHAINLLEVTPWVIGASDAAAPAGPYYADGSDDYYTLYGTAVDGESGKYVLYATGVSDGVRQTTSATVYRNDNLELKSSYAMIMGGGMAWLPSSLRINGNFHVNGHLFNLADLRGDASAQGVVIDIFRRIRGSATQGVNPVSRPGIEASDYSMYYTDGAVGQAAQITSSRMGRRHPLARGRAITEANPGGVVVVTPRGGRLWLGRRLNFRGTLVVNGDVILNGDHIRLRAQNKFPSLVVTGKIFVRNVTDANIQGLVVAEQGIRPMGSTRNSKTRIRGGLVTGSYGFNLGLSGNHRIIYNEQRAKVHDFRQIAGIGRVTVLSYGQ